MPTTIEETLLRHLAACDPGPARVSGWALPNTLASVVTLGWAESEGPSPDPRDDLAYPPRYALYRLTQAGRGVLATIDHIATLQGHGLPVTTVENWRA